MLLINRFKRGSGDEIARPCRSPLSRCRSRCGIRLWPANCNGGLKVVAIWTVARPRPRATYLAAGLAPSELPSLLEADVPVGADHSLVHARAVDVAHGVRCSLVVIVPGRGCQGNRKEHSGKGRGGDGRGRLGGVSEMGGGRWECQGNRKEHSGKGRGKRWRQEGEAD